MNNESINITDVQGRSLSLYRGLYHADIAQRLEQSPEQITPEEVRDNMYGYIFEPAYQQERLPDAFSMDYWQEYEFNKEIPEEPNGADTADEEFDLEAFQAEMEKMDDTELQFFCDAPQEMLIIKAMHCTGDGLTPETALWVLDVHQEYEYVQRHIIYSGMQFVQQSYCNGVDCMELQDTNGEVTKLYFRVLNMR